MNDFREVVGPFTIWVEAPSPGVYLLPTAEDVLDFLTHEDGANVDGTRQQLINWLSKSETWSKDADGNIVRCFAAQGFTKFSLFRNGVTPTILIDRCAWCGETHLGGLEYCEIQEA